MKLITAIIKPFKLDEVSEALRALGYADFTATDVKVLGVRKHRTELYRGAEYVVDHLPKIQVGVIAVDSRVAQTIGAIREAAKTGRDSDCWITVAPIEEFWDIESGEKRGKENVSGTM